MSRDKAFAKRILVLNEMWNVTADGCRTDTNAALSLRTAERVLHFPKKLNPFLQTLTWLPDTGNTQKAGPVPLRRTQPRSRTTHARPQPPHRRRANPGSITRSPAKAQHLCAVIRQILVSKPENWILQDESGFSAIFSTQYFNFTLSVNPEEAL